MWGNNINILDETHLLKDIVPPLAPIRSSVNNREGKGVPVLKNEQCWHSEDFVNFTSDVRQRGAAIILPTQLHGEEKIRLIDARVKELPGTEVGIPSYAFDDFVIGNLEKEIDGVPFME